MTDKMESNQCRQKVARASSHDLQGTEADNFSQRGSSEIYFKKWSYTRGYDSEFVPAFDLLIAHMRAMNARKTRVDNLRAFMINEMICSIKRARYLEIKRPRKSNDKFCSWSRIVHTLFPLATKILRCIFTIYVANKGQELYRYASYN